MSMNSRARWAVFALSAILPLALVGCSSMISGVAISISGSALRPLSPGEAAAVNVKISNPHDFTLAVHNLEVTVRSIRVPKATVSGVCALRNYVVQQIAKDVVIMIPPHSSRTLKTLRVPEESWPHVVMVNSSVDQGACRAATIKLGYTATAKLGAE